MDTTSLLQEYLLLSHIHAIQNIHIGASIANELKCLTVPQYHVVPYTYTVFRNERIAAAKKMSQLRSEHLKVSAVIKFKDRAGESSSSAENTVSSSASDRIGARQAEQFNLKSHFISEIAAIEHPSVKEEGEFNSLVAFSRDVCRALAEMSSGYAFAEGEAGLIVEVLWRAAALLYVWNSSATQAHASHHIHSHRYGYIHINYLVTFVYLSYFLHTDIRSVTSRCTMPRRLRGIELSSIVSPLCL